MRDSEKKRNEAYEGEGNSGIVGIRKLFENLPELMIPEEAARVLNKSVKTLYDWHYRGKTRKRKIPSNLFLKVGGGLYLRKDILCAWVSDRSSSL